MNKGFKVLTILIGSASAFSVFASEQPSDKNFYLQGNLGIAKGGYPGKDFEQNSFGNSGIYGLAIGYKFNEHFRADFGVDRRSTFKHKWTHSGYSVAAKQNISDTQRTNVKSWSIMATGYYDIVEINKFTPYVLLGAGIARHTTESSGNVSGEGNSNSVKYTWEKGNKINFAWKIGAGTKYKINNSFDIGLNYQYVDLGRLNTGNVKYISNATSSKAKPAAKDYGKLKSHEMLINFIFNF